MANSFMPATKLLTLWLFLALTFTITVIADVSVDGEDPIRIEEVVGSHGVDASAYKAEIDQLKSRIQFLETQIDVKSQDLKGKEEILAQKEKVIREKSDGIASLQSEISSLQTKDATATADKVRKAHARVGDLEKQVDSLRNELEAKKKDRESLEVRTSEAEEKVNALTLKLEQLQKTKDEKKNRIEKLERALKAAEEETVKARHETTFKTKELMEVHGSWLPPWLNGHWIICQSFAEMHWNTHGKPVMELVIQKVIETTDQTKTWAEPHIETIKTKYIPAVTEQWSIVAAHLEPHMNSLSARGREAYVASITAVAPHISKVQEFVEPHFKEAKKLSKPYIDHVATATKPHVDKVRVVMKPYTKKMVDGYEIFLKTAITYHDQVRGSVKEFLNRHETTRQLVNEELEWFVASALLALPVFFFVRVFRALFFKRSKKPTRHSNGHHQSRRKKRVHVVEK